MENKLTYHCYLMMIVANHWMENRLTYHCYLKVCKLVICAYVIVLFCQEEMKQFICNTNLQLNII